MTSASGASSQTLTPEELLGPLNEVESKFAPKRLFVAGATELLKARPRVAIIGSRNASDDGLRRASKLAKELVREGVVIVSGLAEGIDTAAHTTAIQLGGRTVAVIGTGLDQTFPTKNRDLQNQIAADHLLVSQFDFGTPIQRKNFPLRNRTMALVSHASVIVEAGESSGSLSQGWEALRLGRPLFLLRSLVENKALKWPAEMVEYGASVLTRTDDVLDAIPMVDYAELAF